MKSPFFAFILSLLMLSCSEKPKVDLLVTNAKVYTVNENFSVVEAFAVKNGRIAETGNTAELKNKYSAEKVLDVDGKSVFPGFIDAHAHFFGLGLQQQQVDLTGTKSFEEVVERITEFQKENKFSYIKGRGWDQNDWEVKEFPNKKILDSLFPETPVAITRIDGHAMLVNQAALDLAGIDKDTKYSGGKIVLENGEMTGILIDNPMDLVYGSMPKPTRAEAIKALMDAQKIGLQYGLTTVVDAGLDKETIMLMDSLHKTGDLKTRIYAMASANPENLDYYLENGIYKTEKLHVCSFKVYADGALGSRGAALKEPYSDKPGHFGSMLIGISEFKKMAKRIHNSNFQMNTHAIGDSANAVVLRTYSKLLNENEDRRWRVEHAQVIDEKDFNYFGKNIIPSVQPTHATSDMYWAEDRLGEERIKNAYAFDKLLEEAGIVALGTDFPVESPNPFLTFYAAVARKDLSGFPENGFQPENALSRKETLKGMTIWAAYANFEEMEKGSLEVGKFADFVVLSQDIMEVDIKKIPQTAVLATYIGGEKVFGRAFVYPRL
jgi:predicted amidohydrolase YtcJ